MIERRNCTIATEVEAVQWTGDNREEIEEFVGQSALASLRQSTRIGFLNVARRGVWTELNYWFVIRVGGLMVETLSTDELDEQYPGRVGI